MWTLLAGALVAVGCTAQLGAAEVTLVDGAVLHCRDAWVSENAQAGSLSCMTEKGEIIISLGVIREIKKVVRP